MRRLCILAILAAMPAFGAWSAVYKLTLNGTGQANFPVAFSSANNTAIAALLPKFATTANGGLVTSASGFDIVFTSDQACTTVINFERVIWSAGSGGSTPPALIQFFFQATSNGTAYLCIGNSAVTTDQSHPTATWSANFQCVFHTPNGSSLASPSIDTANSCGNATLNNSPTASTSTVGGAATFNGTNQYLSFTGITFSQPFTILAWLKPSNFSADHSFIGSGNGGLGFRIDTSGHIYVTRTNAADDSFSTGTLTANVWNRIAFVQDGTAHCTYYINGVVASTTFTSCQSAFTAATTTIGVGFTATSGFFPGSIAEVYFMNTNVATNWITDDNASQQASSTFISLAAVSSFVANQSVIVVQ